MSKPGTKPSQDKVSGATTPQEDKPACSPGTTSASVTPKDVSPTDASAKDVVERKTDCEDVDEQEEALLDEAVDLSFPASDPIAIPSHQKTLEKKKAGKNQSPSR
jgi:hypothetical protein